MNPICAALDVKDPAAAERLASRLAGHVGLFKVGLELFLAHGRASVDAIRKFGAAYTVAFRPADGRHRSVQVRAPECVREYDGRRTLSLLFVTNKTPAKHRMHAEHGQEIGRDAQRGQLLGLRALVAQLLGGVAGLGD